MGEEATNVAHGISALVLASGLSRRFGEENKLLMLIGGTSVIRRTVQAYVSAGLIPVVVVIGHDGTRVGASLMGLPVTLINNPDFDQGQSRSLVHGVSAVSAETDAAIIGVADQPFLTVEVVQALVARFRESHAPIVAPRYAGQRGNPVLFRADLFPELRHVEGDQGGRPLLLRYANSIEWVDIEDARIGEDIDTPEEFRRVTNV